MRIRKMAGVLLGVAFCLFFTACSSGGNGTKGERAAEVIYSKIKEKVPDAEFGDLKDSYLELNENDLSLLEGPCTVGGVPTNYQVLFNLDADGTLRFQYVEVDGKVYHDTISDNSSKNPVVTLAKFNAIDTGMSYDEVKEIIGSDGILISSSDLGLGDEYISEIYQWDGAELGANAIITFQDDEVIAKAQYGLT